MAEDVVKKSLKYSIYDGAAFAVMDGLTASFLTPFAVALNASVSLIAALTYVPQLLGASIQLFTASIVFIFYLNTLAPKKPAPSKPALLFTTKKIGILLKTFFIL